MFPRKFLLVTAFAVMIGAAAAQEPGDIPGSGRPSSQSAQVPSDNQAQPQRNQQPATSEAPIVNTPEPQRQGHAGQNSGQHGNTKGAGEESHSYYESLIAYFTIALAFATIMLMFATFLLWWETKNLAKQAKEASADTKKSIEIAQRASEAAVEANRINRDWMVQEYRPWIEAVEVSGLSVFGGPDGGSAAAWIRLSNSGTAPASFIVVRLVDSTSDPSAMLESIRQVSQDMPDVSQPNVMPGNADVIGNLFPNETATTDPIEFTVVKPQGIDLGGKGSVWVGGVIYYRNATLETNHLTPFLVRITYNYEDPSFERRVEPFKGNYLPKFT